MYDLRIDSQRIEYIVTFSHSDLVVEVKVKVR